MASDSPLSRALVWQARVCAAFGSPFSSAFLLAAEAGLAEGGPGSDLLAPFATHEFETLIAEAATLRLLGAFHDLKLSGLEPAVVEAYPAPERPGDAARAWAACRDAIPRHAERLAAFMTHEPQTNETRRSICLLGGFLTVAKETGLPLRCLELAASAGLNQSWDRFHYRLGEAATWGDPASPVQLRAAWTGALPPLDIAPIVAERAACDRAPIDIRDPDQRRRLTSYIWADQIERLQRLDAAAEVALANGVRVDRADARDWVLAHGEPRAGVATVLYHSIFWQYMSPADQRALRATIADMGAKAAASKPLAWLRMEPPENQATPIELRLTLWPGGEDRLLAHVHAHGAEVNWLA